MQWASVSHHHQFSIFKVRQPLTFLSIQNFTVSQRLTSSSIQHFKVRQPLTFLSVQNFTVSQRLTSSSIQHFKVRQPLTFLSIQNFYSEPASRINSAFYSEPAFHININLTFYSEPASHININSAFYSEPASHMTSIQHLQWASVSQWHHHQFNTIQGASVSHLKVSKRLTNMNSAFCMRASVSR